MPQPKATVLEGQAASDTRNSLERPSVTEADASAVDNLLDDVLGASSGPDPAPKVSASEPKPKAGAEPKPAAEPKPGEGEPPAPKPGEAAKPAAPTAKPGEAGAEPPKPGTATPPEPKTEGTPPAPPVPPTKPTEPPDPEIDAIEKPRGMSPKNDGNWDALRTVAKREKAARVAAEEALAARELEASKLPEHVEKELTGLREMRRALDLRNDPYIKQTYDTPIASTKQQIYDLLAECGMSKEKIDKMDAAGGPSSETPKWWDEEVFTRLKESEDPKEQAAAMLLQQMLGKHAQLQFERNLELNKAAKGESDWLKKRDEESRQQQQQERDFMVSRLAEIQKTQPWANPVEIPANATPEQRAQAEAHNEFYRQTVARLRIALKPETPQQRLETAIAAAGFFKAAQENRGLLDQVKFLQEENTRLKSAGVTKGGPGATPPVGAPKKTTLGDQIKMKNEDAIDKGLDEVTA